MGIKRPSDFILTLEDNDTASPSESESESENNATDTNKKAKKRKMDEDLNADFEFDGYGVLGGVKRIDDDGWGFTGIPGMKESAGVDLEGIIARRRAKNSNEEENDGELTSGDDDEDDEEEEEKKGEEEVVDSDETEEFKGIEDDLGVTFIHKRLQSRRGRIWNGRRRRRSQFRHPGRFSKRRRSRSRLFKRPFIRRRA